MTELYDCTLRLISLTWPVLQRMIRTVLLSETNFKLCVALNVHVRRDQLTKGQHHVACSQVTPQKVHIAVLVERWMLTVRNE